MADQTDPTVQQAAPPAAEQAPKADATKQEAAKQEAAKQEAAKQEAAKQEAAKQEAAKQEAAKQEAAKQEAAKQEAAKQEAARRDAAQAPTPAGGGSLQDLLQAAARAAATERSAAPLALVLGRAAEEAQGGEIGAATRRMLQAALTAAAHNPHLSEAARAAIAAVRSAL